MSCIKVRIIVRAREPLARELRWNPDLARAPSGFPRHERPHSPRAPPAPARSPRDRPRARPARPKPARGRRGARRRARGSDGHRGRGGRNGGGARGQLLAAAAWGALGEPALGRRQLPDARPGRRRGLGGRPVCPPHGRRRRDGRPLSPSDGAHARRGRRVRAGGQPGRDACGLGAGERWPPRALAPRGRPARSPPRRRLDDAREPAGRRRPPGRGGARPAAVRHARSRHDPRSGRRGDRRHSGPERQPWHRLAPGHWLRDQDGARALPLLAARDARSPHAGFGPDARRGRECRRLCPDPLGPARHGGARGAGRPGRARPAWAG